MADRSNKKVTNKQFATGTTIDGSEIDHAIDEIVDMHNEVPSGYTEGRMTKTDYVAHWSAARSTWNSVAEDEPATGAITVLPQGRISPSHSLGGAEHYFPFMVCRNWVDETYPLSVRVPDPLALENEYRHKGFAERESDLEYDRYIRNLLPSGQAMAILNNPSSAPTMDFDSGAAWTAGPVSIEAYNAVSIQGTAIDSTIGRKYMAVTFSYYFDKPVILSSLSMIAAQEHPVSYFTMGDNAPRDAANPFFQLTAGTPYKGLNAGTVQLDNKMTNDNTTFRTTNVSTVGGQGKYIETNIASYSDIEKTGNSFQGSNFAPANPEITLNISIDDVFNTEQRNLNSVIINAHGGRTPELGIGFEDTGEMNNWTFNRVHTSTNTMANLVAGPGLTSTCGGAYADMQPAYPGGSTWGRWFMEQNMNVPIPAKSRVRFAIIVKGHAAALSHEWNTCLTVLEEIEK